MLHNSRNQGNKLVMKLLMVKTVDKMNSKR
jgi:hypothetical protein